MDYTLEKPGSGDVLSHFQDNSGKHLTFGWTAKKQNQWNCTIGWTDSR